MFIFELQLRKYCYFYLIIRTIQFAQVAFINQYGTAHYIMNKTYIKKRTNFN
jgi:hypothetical protein